MISITRYHDFSYGHRVCDHESKCRHLHGHNGRVHFTCEAAGGLDALGRVIDFGVVKDRLCRWIEENWDHQFLLWQDDPARHPLLGHFLDSVVLLPNNPTAENMAAHLLNVVGPQVLGGTGVRLVGVTLEETRKCSATARLPGPEGIATWAAPRAAATAAPPS